MSVQYKVTTHQHGAEFHTPGNGGCLLIFVGLIGLGMLGYLYYRFDGIWPGWNGLEGLDYALLGIGGAFTTAGASFYFNQNADAHTILFDNTRHAVRVEQKGRHVVIPYQDIVGFSVRAERSSSSSDAAKTFYNYVVYWYKKDGSVWDVQSESTPDKANALRDQLTQAIDLETPGLENIALEAPRRINYEETGSGAIFRWKNPFSADHLIFLILVLCISTALYGMFLLSLDGFDAWAHRLIFGFFAIVLVFVVGTHLFRIIKNVLGVYQLKIDPDGVEFALMRSGKKLTSKTMPLQDVKSVMFDCQGEIDEVTLHVLNTDQFEMVQKEVHGDLSIKDAPRLLKTMLTNTIALRIDSLDLVDRVHLEQLVEAAVRRAGNEVVM